MARTVKNPPANAVDLTLIPGSARSPREGNDNPLQYSCLENFRDRGAWWATVHGVTKSQKWLSDIPESVLPHIRREVFAELFGSIYSWLTHCSHLLYCCLEWSLQRRQWHPTPVLLPRKSHGWRSLVGYSPQGYKELDMTEWLHFWSKSNKN